LKKKDSETLFKKIEYTPKKWASLFFHSRFSAMCLMCAHTSVFLHDAEEGPRSLCSHSFMNTTPTRGEKLISSQNGMKFWRTKWGYTRVWNRPDIRSMSQNDFGCKIKVHHKRKLFDENRAIFSETSVKNRVIQRLRNFHPFF